MRGNKDGPAASQLIFLGAHNHRYGQNSQEKSVLPEASEGTATASLRLSQVLASVVLHFHRLYPWKIHHADVGHQTLVSICRRAARLPARIHSHHYGAFEGPVPLSTLGSPRLALTITRSYPQATSPLQGVLYLTDKFFEEILEKEDPQEFRNPRLFILTRILYGSFRVETTTSVVTMSGLGSATRT